MIVIPYAVGAATPSRLADAARACGRELAFVVDPTDREAAAHTGLLDAFGAVVVAGSTEAAAAALADRRLEAVLSFADSTLVRVPELAERWDC